MLSIPTVRKSLHLDNPDYESLETMKKTKDIAILGILRNQQILILLTVASIQYSCWTTHQAALSTVLSKKYHLAITKIGLCYLPNGVCSLISMVTCGKYLNYSYKKGVMKHQKWLKE